VFAPRIEVPGPVKDVVLDGRPYRYFDGNLVFLPNRPGRYRVEVTLGEPDAPRLARTTMVVDEAKWDPQTRTLSIRTSPPEWCPRVPGDARPAALVDLGKRQATGISGGEKGNEEGSRVVVWYRDGFELNCR